MSNITQLPENMHSYEKNQHQLLYLDIIPNDILQYMLINEYLSPELNIMWDYLSSLNKAILRIPNREYQRRNIDELLCNERI